MTLRRQLLVVSLLTLLLPWGGCRIVAEMEQTLRDGQQDILRTAAAAVANGLTDNRQQIYRTSMHESEQSWPAYDLYAIALDTAVAIDGFVDEWDESPQPAPWSGANSGGANPLTFLLGRRGDYLYLFLAMQSGTLTGAAHPDHADVFVETPDRELLRLRFEGRAPGPVLPAITVVGGGQGSNAVSPQRFVASWQETGAGFNLELRIPRDVAGARIGFVVTAEGGNAQAGSMPARHAGLPGRWFAERPALSAWLDGFGLPGIQLTVVDRHGWISGRSRTGKALEERAGASSLALRIYRLLLPQPDLAPIAPAAPGRATGTAVAAALSGRDWVSRQRDQQGNPVLIASSPIRADSDVIGAVIAEQPSDAYLSLTDPAAARLLNLTLVITFGLALALIAFASVMSWRVTRLRRAAQNALDSRGRLRTRMPGAGTADELGDLARGFEQLLRQVEEYTRYLHSLGDKLAHELRTPLTVVRSSLENLDPEGLSAADRPYLERARAGADRLNALLSALREANRIEQSLNYGDFEIFDLGEMVENMADGYRHSFRDRQVSACTIAAPVLAAPGLISQLIDKLAENAIEFTPAGGRVSFALAAVADADDPAWRLTVENDGPRLPARQSRQLFDSLVSHRADRGDTPHLGLGLYIVRLIAEFHGGRVEAANSETLSGAAFSVTLPAADASR